MVTNQTETLEFTHEELDIILNGLNLFFEKPTCTLGDARAIVPIAERILAKLPARPPVEVKEETKQN